MRRGGSPRIASVSHSASINTQLKHLRALYVKAGYKTSGFAFHPGIIPGGDHAALLFRDEDQIRILAAVGFRSGAGFSEDIKGRRSVKNIFFNHRYSGWDSDLCQ